MLSLPVEKPCSLLGKRDTQLHIGSCPLFFKSEGENDIFFQRIGRFGAQRSLESLSWKKHSQVWYSRHRDGKWVAPGHIMNEW